MINREKEILKNISNETIDRDFEFNKLRSEITLLKNGMEWEQIISEPMVTQKVRTYINKNLFDFENYDYKIDAYVNSHNINGNTWNNVNFQVYLLDSANTRLKFHNHWCRINMNENCEPESNIEKSVTAGGYAKSKYNDTVFCYGFDSNDGEDGVRFVMEIIPSILSKGTKTLSYSVDMASNSIWRQMFYHYKGTLVDEKYSIENIRSLEITNATSLVFVPNQCYIRVFRRRGGFNKFN